ncbi:MAG: ABC transporter ATP-binding protein [Deltaproteobacteria bacterium]|nr:ABC transporter ATP-binding protein [Deltaproteobacteria bacterium]
MSPPEAAVRARGLGKRFGPVVALDAVDLDVPAGATLAVLGPNGAGKSTLLRLLAGLARPSLGSLCVGSQRESRPAARGRVGYVGHATFLYPALSARENLVFAARLYGVADPAARAGALLAANGLTSVADRRAGSFSRGMAQRLAIARGLVHDPAVVLLDEPFAGLDRTSAARLADALRRLHAEGRTLVLVTHELGVASALADLAIVLERGRIVHRAAGAELEAATLDAAYARAVEPAA